MRSWLSCHKNCAITIIMIIIITIIIIYFILFYFIKVNLRNFSLDLNFIDFGKNLDWINHERGTWTDRNPKERTSLLIGYDITNITAKNITFSNKWSK